MGRSLAEPAAPRMDQVMPRRRPQSAAIPDCRGTALSAAPGEASRTAARSAGPRPAPRAGGRRTQLAADWPGGPGDPVWYVRLRDRDCGNLQGFDEPLDTMEKVAKSLCLGLEGDQAAWDKGASALERMASPNLGNSDCWSVVAYKLLRDVAAFRRQGRMRRSSSSPSQAPPASQTFNSLRTTRGTRRPFPSVPVMRSSWSGLSAVSPWEPSVRST